MKKVLVFLCALSLTTTQLIPAEGGKKPSEERTKKTGKRVVLKGKKRKSGIDKMSQSYVTMAMPVATPEAEPVAQNVAQDAGADDFTMLGDLEIIPPAADQPTPVTTSPTDYPALQPPRPEIPAKKEVDYHSIMQLYRPLENKEREAFDWCWQHLMRVQNPSLQKQAIERPVEAITKLIETYPVLLICSFPRHVIGLYHQAQKIDVPLTVLAAYSAAIANTQQAQDAFKVLLEQEKKIFYNERVSQRRRHVAAEVAIYHTNPTTLAFLLNPEIGDLKIGKHSVFFDKKLRIIQPDTHLPIALITNCLNARYRQLNESSWIASGPTPNPRLLAQMATMLMENGADTSQALQTARQYGCADKACACDIIRRAKPKGL